MLYQFLKILSIHVFLTENFSAKLWLLHSVLSLYFITSTFSFNVKPNQKSMVRCFCKISSQLQLFLCVAKKLLMEIRNNWTRLSNCMRHFEMKIPDINPGFYSKIYGNSTFVLKLISGSFCIQNCNLRPTSFPVAYLNFEKRR